MEVGQEKSKAQNEAHRQTKERSFNGLRVSWLHLLQDGTHCVRRAVQTCRHIVMAGDQTASYRKNSGAKQWM